MGCAGTPPRTRTISTSLASGTAILLATTGFLSYPSLTHLIGHCWACSLSFGHYPRDDALAGLGAVLKEAKELGYKRYYPCPWGSPVESLPLADGHSHVRAIRVDRCHIDALVALGLGQLKAPSGRGWTSNIADVEKAEAHLEAVRAGSGSNAPCFVSLLLSAERALRMHAIPLCQAMKLIVDDSSQHAAALTQRALCHLVPKGSNPWNRRWLLGPATHTLEPHCGQVRAAVGSSPPHSLDATLDAGSEPEALRALRCAEHALLIRRGSASSVSAALDELLSGSGTTAVDAPTLTNLAVAMALSQRASSDQPHPDARAAAAAARPLLERARMLVPDGDDEAHARALLALAGVNEAGGDAAQAAQCLNELLVRMQQSTAAQGGSAADAAARAAHATAAGDHWGALRCYKESLAQLDLEAAAACGGGAKLRPFQLGRD